MKLSTDKRCNKCGTHLSQWVISIIKNDDVKIELRNLSEEILLLKLYIFCSPKRSYKFR